MLRYGRPHMVFLWALLEIILNSRAIAQVSNVITNFTHSEGNTTLPNLELPIDSFLNATGREPQCSSLRYPDEGLSVESCEDAIAQVPDTHSALLSSNGEKLELPVRFSSSDGKCAINLQRLNPNIRERVSISGKNLRLQAKRIVDTCVQGRDRSTGGTVKVQRGGKVINISVEFFIRYQQVECLADRRPFEPPPSNCVETLEKMQKTDSWTRFSLQPEGHQAIELPEMIIDSRFNCMVTIELMQDASTRGMYKQLWTAAVAIDAMCVRQGRSGWAMRLGDAHEIQQHGRRLGVVIENAHNRIPNPHNVLRLPSSGDQA